MARAQDKTTAKTKKTKAGKDKAASTAHKKSKSTKNNTTPNDKKRSLLWRFTKLCLVLGIWGFLVVLCVIAYYCHDLPDTTRAAQFDRKRSVTFYADDGTTVIARYGELLGENLTYEDLPPHLIEAVLATEDRRFFYHFGIDPIGIARAFMTNMQSNRIAQGGSTITQQLAKNLFLSSERTLERKIQEAVLAIWLESTYSKKEILASYLNRVYLGAGAYGVDAASQIYFKKPVSALTREESAIIAGLLKAPSRYNPIANQKAAIERMQLVLTLMDEFETSYEKKTAKETETSSSSSSQAAMVVPPSKPYNISYNFDEARYFTDWVIEQIPTYINSPDQDLMVYTTLNLDMQKEAYKNAHKHTIALQERRPKKFPTIPEFSALMTQKDGAIKLMLGGAKYNHSQFNRATQAMRQPGSSFKPFVYLAALESSWDMNDYISDDPFEKNGYEPENYNGEFHGEVPLWEALMYSYNVATVRLLDEVTILPVMQLAQNLGITSEIQPDLSIALGTSETTLLQMVQAYHNIARYQENSSPLYGIKKITLSSNGEVLYERENQRSAQGKNTNLEQFFSRTNKQESMQQLTAMMQGVVLHGTGKRANLGFPVAGKTGTSQNNRDAWFLGFTSHYTAGVWVGYDDNKSMPDVYGGTTPASIWADIVAYAHKDVQAGPLLSRSYNFDYKSSFFGRFSSNRSSGNSPYRGQNQKLSSPSYRGNDNGRPDYEWIKNEKQPRDRRLGNNPDSY